MCPLCGYGYRCPCDSCMKSETKPYLKAWIRLEGDFADCEACPCCGLVLHLCDWEDISWEQAKEQYRLSNEVGGCLSDIYEEDIKISKK